ncbi:hypothetical protein C8R48DRAFT_726122, partial [Suillus tomentosus]
IWDDKRKEMLVVLAFTFIIHTFPGLEHSSPLPCRDIRSIIGPHLDLYLPRPHPRTIRPSVIYFNAQGKHFYGSPFIRISHMDDGEIVIPIRNHCSISHPNLYFLFKSLVLHSPAFADWYRWMSRIVA